MGSLESGDLFRGADHGLHLWGKTEGPDGFHQLSGGFQVVKTVAKLVGGLAELEAGFPNGFECHGHGLPGYEVHDLDADCGQFVATDATKDFVEVAFEDFEVVQSALEVGDFQLKVEGLGQGGEHPNFDGLGGLGVQPID